MSRIIQTAAGQIQGLEHHDYHEFRGIPYAQPPVGRQRFAPPQPLEPWEGVRKADRFGDASVQEETSLFGIGHTSEDCLHLNVWTPCSDDQARPVMVWIHGGAYVTGSGAQLIYRGRDLARNGNVVVVTLNYRLGALGFLHLADRLGPDVGVSNNLGLQDQVAALRWVKQNIAAFGGDPDQITLFGESAGAMSIAALITMPSAQGLFQRAILQSGSGDMVLTRDEANQVADTFLAAAGVSPDDPEALWSLDKRQILKAQAVCNQVAIDRGLHRQSVPHRGMALVPMIDGDLLPQAPITALQGGAASGIPLLVGATRDEWNLFLHTPGPQGEDSLAKTRYKDLDKAGLIKVCERDLPGLGEKSANHYEQVALQRNADASYLDMYSAFESDRVFRIPTIRLAEAQSQHSSHVYHYSLDWDKGVFGACHAADIPLVFGNVTSGLGQFLTGGCSGAQKLSAIMQGCWIAFARSGNPATDSVGAWPGYNAEQRLVMCFDELCQVADDPHRDSRRFWDGIL